MATLTFSRNSGEIASGLYEYIGKAAASFSISSVTTPAEVVSVEIDDELVADVVEYMTLHGFQQV